MELGITTEFDASVKWEAPEVVEFGTSSGSDVWSYGCVLSKIIGQIPFSEH